MRLCKNKEDIEGDIMKFEKLKHIGNHDWYIQIGDATGKKPCCIIVRYFTKCGYRVTINFCQDKWIRLFGFNQKVFGV